MTKVKPSDIKTFHFRVETKRRTEYHMVFASSIEKAKKILESRYLNENPLISPIIKEKQDA